MNAPLRLAPDGSHELLVRLMEILAPSTRDIVAFLEAYFDESGSHSGSPVLCVAGYLFEKEKCRQFDLEWIEVLHGFQLPYFRMVDCAHGTGPFEQLNLKERIQCETLMIELIKKYMISGFSVTIDETQYDAWRADQYQLFGSAYTWCCWMSLIAVESWAEKAGFDGKIAYFFEAGHDSHAEANRIMTESMDIAGIRYASHAFAKKREMRPLQAADLLAWQAAKFRKEWMKGNRKPRADFRSLVARDTATYHGEKNTFDELYARLGAYMESGGSIDPFSASPGGQSS
jgi:hypothetical protein